MPSVGRHMVFALAADDGGLMAFPSAREAEAYCEGLDVGDGVWLFFADDGSPLEARFERPNRRGPFTVSGTYRLQRALSGRWLQEQLDQVKTVEGGGLTTMAELVETLKVNRGKRVASEGKRG
jgi:hypothetical protein